MKARVEVRKGSLIVSKEQGSQPVREAQDTAKSRLKERNASLSVIIREYI